MLSLSLHAVNPLRWNTQSFEEKAWGFIPIEYYGGILPSPFYIISAYPVKICFRPSRKMEITGRMQACQSLRFSRTVTLTITNSMQNMSWENHRKMLWLVWYQRKPFFQVGLEPVSSSFAVAVRRHLPKVYGLPCNKSQVPAVTVSTAHSGTSVSRGIKLLLLQSERDRTHHPLRTR